MLIACRVGGSGGGVLSSSEVGVVFLSLTLVFGGGAIVEKAKESSERGVFFFFRFRVGKDARSLTSSSACSVLPESTTSELLTIKYAGR